ncbi:MAG: hypothetical protein ABGW50_05805, partial [Thermococcus sp.]
VVGALEHFSTLVENVAGLKRVTPEVVTVESWKGIPHSDKHYWLPLSEIDVRKGVLYIYGPAVRDTIRNPKLGPFYMMSWELFLGTSLLSLRNRAPDGSLGTLLAGAVSAIALTFNGVENEVSATEYLDKLQVTASTLLEEALRNSAQWSPERTDFYLRAAYQFTFDAVSLWTALTMKTVTYGLVSEKTVAREVVDFLLKDPEVNVGVFHVKGTDMARAIDFKRGSDLAEMAFQVTDAILLASSYPRLDDRDSWRMFR